MAEPDPKKPKKKPSTRKPSFKQQQLVQKIIENNGNVSKSMREVGYAPATVHNPGQVIASKGFQEAAKDVLAQIEELQQQALAELAAKDLSGVSYRDVVYGAKELTQLKQLLSGEATENNKVTIVWGGEEE